MLARSRQPDHAVVQVSTGTAARLSIVRPGDGKRALKARLRTSALAVAARLEDATQAERDDVPAASAADLRLLDGQVARLQAQLGDVQALLARFYEQSFDWQGKLAAVRAASGYGAAWDDAEPLVSVRIATYNNAAVLCDRTLASLRAQTYEHWEAIVVGDAVTDDTEARIAALGDARIHFVNLPIRGPYPADEYRRWLVAGTAPMNRGAREARGAWIAPLDHDDEWDADHVEVLLRHARSTRAELVYGQLRVRDAASGRPLPDVPGRLLPDTVGAWPLTQAEFGFQGAIYHAGLRRFEIDENARFAGEPGDWNLARRMWDAGVRFAFLPREVATYYYAPRDAAGRAWVAQAF